MINKKYLNISEVSKLLQIEEHKIRYWDSVDPKTKEEFNISSRNVITFKASKLLLKYINKNNND